MNESVSSVCSLNRVSLGFQVKPHLDGSGRGYTATERGRTDYDYTIDSARRLQHSTWADSELVWRGAALYYSHGDYSPLG